MTNVALLPVGAPPLRDWTRAPDEASKCESLEKAAASAGGGFELGLMDLAIMPDACSWVSRVFDTFCHIDGW